VHGDRAATASERCPLDAAHRHSHAYNPRHRTTSHRADGAVIRWGCWRDRKARRL